MSKNDPNRLRRAGRRTVVYSTLLLSLTCLLSVCSRQTSAQEAVKPLPAEEKEDENYYAVKREPVGPGRSGVNMTAQLTRGSIHINQGNIPTWKVMLTVGNGTAGVVHLGESLVVVEKERATDNYLAVFVARERSPAADHLKRLSDRYGLTWGVTVPHDEPGVWPFGALTDGSEQYRLGLLLAVLTAPRPKAYRGGGYPSLGPSQQLAIQEELIYPASPKAGREGIFVVAPAIRPVGGQPSIHVFRFDVGESPEIGKAFSPAETQVTRLNREETEKIAADTSQPAWRRIFSLNWLAESAFEPAAALFMRLASENAGPRWLKLAAMLNLGQHHHKPALPLLVRALKESSDPLDQAVAIASLGELGEKTAAADIRPFLTNRNPTVGASAADAVGNLKDEDSVPVLLKLLADRNQEKLHAAICKALSRVGTKPARDGLVGAVADRKHGFQARRWAVLTLGESRYEEAAPVLIKVLADPRDDSGIRMNVISALASLGGPDAWAAIQTAAEGKDKSLAMSAVQAMGGSKDPAQIARVLDIAAKAGHPQRETALNQIRYRKLAGAGATLRTAIRDASTPTDVRITAAAALKAINEPFAAEDWNALWAAYERERDRYARARLADALIEAGFADKGRISSLINELDDDKNQAWYASVKLLRHLTGQTFGPENEFSGDKKSRRAEFDKWRKWWAAQAK